MSEVRSERLRSTTCRRSRAMRLRMEVSVPTDQLWERLEPWRGYRPSWRKQMWGPETPYPPRFPKNISLLEQGGRKYFLGA